LVESGKVPAAEYLRDNAFTSREQQQNADAMGWHLAMQVLRGG